MTKGRNRANGEGTYKKRKDGRWEAQYTVDTPSGTKRKSVYARTKTEVVTKLRKAIAEADGGVSFDAENLTVSEYLDRWLEDSVKGSVWHTTYRDYKGHVRNHIAPEIGRVRLAKLTPAHVQALYRKKSDSGLSPRTVNYIHATLHKALEQAVKWRLIPYNVSDAAVKPRQERRETLALTLEQVYAFLEAAREAEDRFEALYVVAVFTGMRPGELLALRWSDLVLDGPEPEARVRRSLSKDELRRPRIQTDQDRERPLRLPDARGRRGTEGPPQTPDRGTAPVRRLWEDQDLVFSSTRPEARRTGITSLHATTSALRKAAGLPETTRFYDLRHTFATLMLEQGENPKVVQEILGHSQITHTMDTYSHVTPNMQRAAFGRLGERLQRS